MTSSYVTVNVQTLANMFQYVINISVYIPTMLWPAYIYIIHYLRGLYTEGIRSSLYLTRRYAQTHSDMLAVV
jgi:hypothetical protein